MTIVHHVVLHRSVYRELCSSPWGYLTSFVCTVRGFDAGGRAHITFVTGTVDCMTCLTKLSSLYGTEEVRFA